MRHGDGGGVDEWSTGFRKVTREEAAKIDISLKDLISQSQQQDD